MVYVRTSALGRLLAAEGASVDRHLEELGLPAVHCGAAVLRTDEIDERVHAFLSRPIEGCWPYLWIDATYVKVRQAKRIIPVAVIIAVGGNVVSETRAFGTTGRREVLGMAIGPSEAEPFWTDFLRSLTGRGLRGVKLVISDAHEGLKEAAAKVLQSTWQRCRVGSLKKLESTDSVFLAIRDWRDATCWGGRNEISWSS